MAAYRRVYESRHLQAHYHGTGISSGTLLSAMEYGLYLYFFYVRVIACQVNVVFLRDGVFYENIKTVCM